MIMFPMDSAVAMTIQPLGSWLQMFLVKAINFFPTFRSWFMRIPPRILC